MSDVTAVIQIGNSDNKLTQAEWSGLQRATYAWVAQVAREFHFDGGSPSASPFQNACIVIEIEEAKLPALRASLATIAQQFRQDSIALTLGTTEFVPPTMRSNA